MTEERIKLLEIGDKIEIEIPSGKKDENEIIIGEFLNTQISIINGQLIVVYRYINKYGYQNTGYANVWQIKGIIPEQP